VLWNNGIVEAHRVLALGVDAAHSCQGCVQQNRTQFDKSIRSDLPQSVGSADQRTVERLAQVVATQHTVDLGPTLQMLSNHVHILKPALDFIAGKNAVGAALGTGWTLAGNTKAP
jgi:hypothetical protein